MSDSILKDLDAETLAKMISAFLVLKANGHPDNDMVSFLMRKDTKTTMKLGFKMSASILPSLLTDSEFRSLVWGTYSQLKKQKERKNEKQRKPQKALAKAPKNRAKVGPVTVTVEPQATAPQGSFTG
jgi:hypothetical protein